MTTKYYEGNNHVFYSNNSQDNVINIKAGQGQTLNIQGGGQNPGEPNKSIQFNNDGVFGGDETMLFDVDNKTLKTDNMNTGFISGSISSDILGYNEIYRGPYNSPPQDVTSSGAAAYNFGADVSSSILNGVNIFATANPNYVLGGSTGGISIFQKSGEVFTESQIISYSNFTLEKTMSCVSVNQDGNYLFYVDNNQEFYYSYIYKLDGSTYTYLNESDYDSDYLFHYGKITDHNSLVDKLYCIACDPNGKFFSCLIDKTTGEYTDFATFFDAGTTYPESYIPLQINTLGLILWGKLDDSIFLYKWNAVEGNYILDNSYDTSGQTVNGIDMKWDGNNTNSLTLTVSTSTKYYIIKDGNIEMTVNNASQACATNLTYCFFYSGGNIVIYKKVEGVWTASDNVYALDNVNHMTCDNQYLYVSQTAANKGTVFKIETYNDTDVQITRIDMAVGSAGVLSMNAYGGIEANTDMAENFNFTTNGKVLVNDGNATSTSASFGLGSDSHGLSYADSVVNCISGNQLSMTYSSLSVKAKKRLWSEGGLTSSSGTEENPSISFNSDVQTGLYLYDNAVLGISTGGELTATINATLSAFYSVIGTNNGSKTSPQHSFHGHSDAGLYYDTTFIGSGICAGEKRCAIFTNGEDGKPRVNIAQDIGSIYCNNSGGASVKIDNYNDALETKTGIEFNVYGTTPSVSIESYYFCAPSLSPVLVGSITTNGTTTSYNTTSDYRMKSDVKINENAVDNIMKLKPVEFKWITNGKKDTGFLAHEFQEVYDSCVYGEKDGKNYQSMDSRGCISDLVRTAQILLQKVSVLESEIEVLKTKKRAPKKVSFDDA